MQICMPIRVAGAAVVVLMLLSSAAAIGAGPVTISNSWVRATVPGQSVAGAYMDITATAPAALIAAESPVAMKVEAHTMTLAGGVMKMRPVERIELPARATVSLKPGGYHLMLVDIKRQLKPGERVPITLTVQDRKGVKSTLRIEAEVRSAASEHMQHKM